jgi:hypothetical protein
MVCLHPDLADLHIQIPKNLAVGVDKFRDAPLHPLHVKAKRAESNRQTVRKNFRSEG